MRKEIISLLCNTSLFPIGYTGFSWEIADIILANLKQNPDNVKDIHNSIREALETVDGYIYSNGTNCLSKRQVNKEHVPCTDKHRNPRGYNVQYEFGDIVNESI